MHSNKLNLTGHDVDFGKTSLCKSVYFPIKVCTTGFTHEYVHIYHVHSSIIIHEHLQYSLRLSWHSCAVNTCVFFNFYRVSSQNMRVTQNGLHTSQLSCTVCELFFMLCTRVIIHVMHDSKKHVSKYALCAACESVFLGAACKLTSVFYQRRIRHTMKKHPSKTW